MKKLQKYSLLIYILVMGLLTAISAKAQPVTPDSVQILTLKEFYQLILQHHPVASQAELLTEQAKQELRMARGTLDPVFNSKLSRKEFGGKEYYTTWTNTLRIPTWFGPEIRAGFDKAQGQYLNPENKTPENGLSYAGISVPLGQGLFIDERRNTIQQARLAQDIAEADRVKMINKLLLEATKDYRDWQLYYNTMLVYRESLELAAFRLSAVRARVWEGDLAAIDTVEALTEVQNRDVMLQEALLDYNNARLRISQHLWAENNVPLELEAQTIPSVTDTETIVLSTERMQQVLESARTNHPDLRKVDLKGQQLTFERRMATNKLLPKLNADYNVLQRDFFVTPEAFEEEHLGSNYKLGASLSIPLFMREERGKLQLTKVKQQHNTLELAHTTRAVENGILAAYNEWLSLENQIALQERMVDNARTLRNGELTRFQNGESSLFLINTREMKLMEAQVKLLNLKAKYAKARAQLYWAAGSLVADE
ncbi:TolC family protein [Pontibacter populi]|uniref:TolC family protein n=1 Tax=Pontibacter populi TaxID=890055 RepID=A0ABV1RT97_9BACT